MKKMRLIVNWLLVFLFCGGSVAFAGDPPSLLPPKAQFKLPKPALPKPAVRPLSQLRAQLKLTFKHFNDPGRGDRSLGERVMALLEVENQGQTTESIRVHYMVGRNPTTASTDVLTLNPGQKLPAVITLTLPSSSRSSDHNIYIDDRNHLWWRPAFAIRKADSSPFTDANMADNAAVPDVLPIALFPRIDLAVLKIDAVRLTETWHGGGPLDEGTTHPVSLDAFVSVINLGLQNSQPATMAVNLASTREAITSARGRRGAQYERVGRCAYWPMCSMTQELTIPAVPAGQTRSFPVHFAPIPHSIERESARHGIKMAGGPYACGRGGWVMASTANITATIRTADEDVAFMHNNSLTKEGKFETTPIGPDPVSCGFQ